VVVDPSGRFVYVANQTTNTTFEFAIDAVTGALTQIGATPPPGPASAGVGAAVEPSGRFAYVTDGFNNNVAAYSIDLATGTLTQITGSPFAAGSLPSLIAADLSGKFVYVANRGDGVMAYRLDLASGSLTAVTGSPFAAGIAPNSVTTTAKIQ
jgi:6-phosphogluconolactonase (cycloisomerase 2 family)